jgi:hypothetical protein
MLEAKCENALGTELIISVNRIRLPATEDLNVVFSEAIVMGVLCCSLTKGMTGIFGAVEAGATEARFEARDNTLTACFDEWSCLKAEERLSWRRGRVEFQQTPEASYGAVGRSCGNVDCDPLAIPVRFAGFKAHLDVRFVLCDENVASCELAGGDRRLGVLWIDRKFAHAEKSAVGKGERGVKVGFGNRPGVSEWRDNVVEDLSRNWQFFFS